MCGLASCARRRRIYEVGRLRKARKTSGGECASREAKQPRLLENSLKRTPIMSHPERDLSREGRKMSGKKRKSGTRSRDVATSVGWKPWRGEHKAQEGSGRRARV
jgi:hypothetical protein